MGKWKEHGGTDRSYPPLIVRVEEAGTCAPAVNVTTGVPDVELTAPDSTLLAPNVRSVPAVLIVPPLSATFELNVTPAFTFTVPLTLSGTLHVRLLSPVSDRVPPMVAVPPDAVTVKVTPVVESTAKVAPGPTVRPLAPMTKLPPELRRLALEPEAVTEVRVSEPVVTKRVPAGEVKTILRDDAK